MEAYQEPGNDVEGNQAVYGKALPRGTQADGASDLERDGSDGQNEENVYDEVPSDMSEVALNSSNSMQNDNYENIE